MRYPFHLLLSTTLILSVAFLWTSELAFAQARPQNSEAQSVDLLNLASGAVVLSQSSQFSEEWAALLLLDDTAEKGWATAQGAAFPHEVLIELAAQTRLATIANSVRSTANPTFCWPVTSAMTSPKPSRCHSFSST